jgi:hypothetical protein
MDKPTTPAGPGGPESLSPESSGSEQGFGATGVFQAVKMPQPDEGLAASSAVEPVALGNRAMEPPKPQPAPAPKALDEPVVHKVVIGGVAESSSALLDRMRRSPATETGGKGSAGFTELLRTLEVDAPSPTAAAKQPPAVETPRPAQESGFTSLLQTLSSPQTPATSSEEKSKTGQYAFGPLPVAMSSEDLKPVPAASSPGGFTELLRAAPAADSAPGSSTQMFRSVTADAPVAGQTAGMPAPAENKPGEFTRLFASLGGAEAASPTPVLSERQRVAPPSASAGSFTQMLSLEPEAARAEIPHYESKPATGSTNYGVTPATAAPERAAGASGDPFSPASFSPAPVPDAQPIQGPVQGTGVGITRLIQMLDEPSKTPAPRREEVVASPPAATQPGAWTQTFASLNTPSEAPAPVAPQPPPPQAYPPASFRAPVASTPAAAPGTAGPSEFTRILDASRIREMAMRGGQLPAVESPVPAPPPQNFTPAAPPIPSYPVPPSPPVVGMPAASVYPPPQPQMPSYPMNYPPHAGSMPAAGGTMPQQPGMYAPAPPMPPAPQAPPLKPVQPGAGKMQQYLLLTGVVIIVLLVAILVTVIFLMKH